MKTDTDFENLVNQVGYGLAVALFEKRLANKFFSSLSADEIVSIAPHVLNNKRLIKLLNERVTHVNWKIRGLVETYCNPKMPAFLKEQIFSKIEKLKLSCQEWLDIESASNSTILSKMTRAKALTSIASFEEGQAVFEKIANRQDEGVGGLLEVLTRFAKSYEDWIWIIGRSKYNPSILELCFSAINKLELSYVEWCNKDINFGGDREVWRRWYALVNTKRKETALTFSDLSNELDILLIDYHSQTAQQESQKEIRVLLKRMSSLATTFTDWYTVYYNAKNTNGLSLKKKSLSELRLRAVEAEDYYLLYIILGEKNKTEKESCITKIISFAPGADFWIKTYNPKWSDQKYLKVAEEALANLSADSDTWLKILRNVENSDSIRKIALRKLSESQNTGDYWCGIHIVSRDSKELRKVCENNLLALSTLCSEWKMLMNKYSSADRYELSTVLFKKIAESAESFDDWLYILQSPKVYNANVDYKKAIVNLGELASSMSEYLSVCLFSETNSSEYKTALNNISLLHLDFKGWLGIYIESANDAKNHCDRSGGNPLAELALAKMAP